MKEGENCWRVARADRMAVIIDAEDYFRHLRSAMLHAQRRIMLVGWDFDGRIVLDPKNENEGPSAVGPFITWLTERNPVLEVYLLRWDMGALKALFRGTNIWTLAQWLWHRRIHTKLDGHHPLGGSHHQKIVIIDDCLAFCGGIDVTAGRWDTRDHLDHDPYRKTSGGRSANPWHDTTLAVSGPIAAALSELACDRWQVAGGKPIGPVVGDSPCWPEGLQANFEGINLAIARTEPAMDGEEGVHESEALFVAQIASARETIYIESQYFAGRLIAEAIAARLDEVNGPEIVIINPKTADGWLEPIAMDTARARLMEALKRRDVHGRLRMYHPYTAGGQAIYCHAKVLIIDDRVLRLGSSNVNNRSMRLDSECDLALEATNDDVKARIRGVRNDLIAEHLGVSVERLQTILSQEGSLIGAIELLRGQGKTLRAYTAPSLSSAVEWLADNELLDPEGPSALFEPLSRRGLFRRWRRATPMAFDRSNSCIPA